VDKVGKLGARCSWRHSREDEIVPFELGRKLFMRRGPAQGLPRDRRGAQTRAASCAEQDWRDAVGKFARLSLSR
jgi:hypothetical protein